MCRFFNRIAKTHWKIAENSEITDSVKIIHCYSLLFIRVLSRSERVDVAEEALQGLLQLARVVQRDVGDRELRLLEGRPLCFFLTPSEKLLITISLTSTTFFLTFSNFSEIIF